MKGKEGITVKVVILIANRRNVAKVAIDLLDVEIFADLRD